MPPDTAQNRWEAAGIDPKNLESFIGSSLHNSLVEIAMGASEDLQKFGFAIARDIIEIQGEPDEDKRAARLAEAKGQVASVAELNRIRLNNIGWREFERFWAFGTGVLDRLLAGALLAV